MKREMLVPVIATSVMVSFAAVSLLVWATRGRSTFLVRRKLALGALLIGLTHVATGCNSPFEDKTITCYAPPAPNGISLTTDPVLNLSVGDSLTGKISNRTSNTFSFRVLDDDSNVLQAEDIAAADGTYDESIEDFTIHISTGLAPGVYWLRFYAMPADEVGPETYMLAHCTLHIVDGR